MLCPSAKDAFLIAEKDTICVDGSSTASFFFTKTAGDLPEHFVGLSVTGIWFLPAFLSRLQSYEAE